MVDFEALTRRRRGRNLRSSSWDRTGANADNVQIKAGETHELLAVEGAGVIRHIWMTVNAKSTLYPREMVIRMYWDGADKPSVNVPLGDFFGLGHAKILPFTSAPITVVTGGRAQEHNHAAFNCWFAMPFSDGARITVTNEGDEAVDYFYYYVDFEEQDAVDSESLRFHAHYRQESLTEAMIDLERLSWQEMAAECNTSDQHNYKILDVKGQGHYIGCVLSIDHFNPVAEGGWFGEGDDMIFIDGRPGLGDIPQSESAPGANDAWPPTLHGTGTEDYFGAAWGYPAHAQSTPYHGVTVAGHKDGEMTDYAGKWSMYRFHLPDPIMFEQSIRVSIEHGHANCHADAYSSVAYWYQMPIAQNLPALPEVKERLPVSDLESLKRYLKTRKELTN